MFATALQAWLNQCGWPVTQQQQHQLLQHLTLLEQWNKVINLTAIPQADYLTHHTLDSISLYPIIADLRANQSFKTLADIGSGNGFPGLSLACLFADMEVTLVESSQKKCRFLRQLTIDLNLANVQIHAERAEQLQQGYDLLVTRATFKPDQLIQPCLPLLNTGGVLLAMMSQASRDTFQSPSSSLNYQWLNLLVPTELGQRVVLKVVKV